MAAERKRPVLAAGLIAAVAVLGLVLTALTLFGRGGQANQAVAVTTAAPVASPEAIGTDPSVCGLPDVQLEGTVDTAPTATWTLVGTTAAPQVEGAGPGRIDADGFRTCYARTPTGALVANANYLALGSYGPTRERFIKEVSAPGPGRDALLRKEQARTNDSSGTRLQTVGFRVLRYTGDQADVDLAVRTSNGALVSFVTYLKWAEGDWKIQVGTDGTDVTAVTQLSDISGYIPWGGA